MLDKPWTERFISRFLTDNERYELLGHAGNVADFFPSLNSRRQAIGNAYAVPQVMSVIIPMLESALHTGVLTPAEEQKSLNPDELASLSNFNNSLNKSTLAEVSKLNRRKVANKRRRVG